MAKFICSACKQTFESQINFCSNCGGKVEEVPEKNICPKCNAEYSTDTKFCAQCGTQLTESAAAPAAPAAPATPAAQKNTKNVVGAICGLICGLAVFFGIKYMDDILDLAYRSQTVEAINRSVKKATGFAPESVKPLGKYNYAVVIWEPQEQKKVELKVRFNRDKRTLVFANGEKWKDLKEQYKILKEFTEEFTQRLKKTDKNATVEPLSPYKFKITFLGVSGSVQILPWLEEIKPLTKADQGLVDTLAVLDDSDDSLVE